MVGPRPSHSEAVPWRRQSTGPFPIAGAGGGFLAPGKPQRPRTGNRSGPRVPDPFVRSARPPGKPTGPRFCAFQEAAPSPLPGGRERRQGPGLRSRPAWLCQCRYGQHRGNPSSSGRDEAAPAGSSERGWKRMKGSKSEPQLLTAITRHRKRE